MNPKLIRLRNLALIVTITAYVLSFFHRVAPAAIAQELVRDFHTSAASLGLLAATYFYVYTFMQVPTGVLADTLGPRKVLTSGSIVAGIGSLIFGLAPSFGIALAGRTLVGLGVAVIFIAMLKLIAVWFEPRRFATITGIAMFLGNTGSVLAGRPLADMAHLVGWRTVFVAAGLLSLTIGIASWFLVRDHPDEGTTAHQPTPSHAWLPELKKVLANRATWPGFLVNFGIPGSTLSFAGLWAVPYLTQGLGLSSQAASSHISIFFLGLAFGCILIGRASDLLGLRKPLMVGGATIYTLCWLVWLWVDAPPLFITYSTFALMGLCASCFTLTWSCAKEVNPPHLSGMATSVVNTGMFLSAAILQPLAGWIMDQTWNGLIAHGVRIYSLHDYRNSLLLHFALSLAGLIATALVRETRCRNIWREK